jgi:hypothetical protein
MSRLVIPVVGQVLTATGDVRLRVEIRLLLKDTAGGFHPQRFRVDTATDITTFPAYEAKRLGLPMPVSATAGAHHTQTGLTIRSGFLRFRVVGMDQTEYPVACLFLGDPDKPPDPARPAVFPRNLLQPFALLDRLRFTLDKDPALGNPYGELVVEKK